MEARKSVQDEWRGEQVNATVPIFTATWLTP